VTEKRREVAQEFVAALIALREHAAAVANLVHYDARDARQRYLLSYFCTAIELAGAAIVLARSAETIGLPILARSALEALVDFRCLMLDPSYVEFIEAAHDAEWAKLINEAIDTPGAYLGELAAHASVNEERERIAHREAHREAIGIRTLTVRNKFRRAGMEGLYHSVYNFFCSETHNNARALINRHFKEDSAGVLRLTIYGDDVATVEPGLSQVHDALSAMTEGICQTFGIAEPDRTAVDKAWTAAKRLVAIDCAAPISQSTGRTDDGTPTVLPADKR